MDKINPNIKANVTKPVDASTLPQALSSTVVEKMMETLGAHLGTTAGALTVSQSAGATQTTAIQSFLTPSTRPKLDPPKGKTGDQKTFNPSPEMLSSIAIWLSLKAGDETKDITSQKLISNTKDQQATNDAQSAQFKKSQEEMAKTQKAGFWGKIFGWVTTAVAVIALAAMATLAVASGGSLAPLAVPAIMATIGLVMMIDAQTGNHISKAIGTAFKSISDHVLMPIINGLIKALTLNQVQIPENAQKIIEASLTAGLELAFTLAITIALFVFNPAAGAELTEEEANELLKLVQKTIPQAATIIEGGGEIGQGSTKVASSVYTEKAQMAEIAANMYAMITKAFNEINQELTKLILEINKNQQSLTADISLILQGMAELGRTQATGIARSTA